MRNTITFLALTLLAATGIAGSLVTFDFTRLTDFVEELDPLVLTPKEQGAALGVRICGRASYDGFVQIENTGANDDQFMTGLNPQPFQIKVGDQILHQEGFPQQIRVWNLPQYDGLTDFDGPSGGRMDFPQVLVMFEFDVVDEPALSMLLSGEPVTMSMKNTSFVGGGGNLTFTAGSEVTAMGTVEALTRNLP